MQPLPPITVSTLDLARLEALVDSPARRGDPAAEALAAELGRARVLDPAQMPGDVVTLGATITCMDEASGETHTLTLVHPDEADAARARISVLAPVGSALLGLAVGQRIAWPGPAGRELMLRVMALSPAAPR